MSDYVMDRVTLGILADLNLDPAEYLAARARNPDRPLSEQDERDLARIEAGAMDPSYRGGSMKLARQRKGELE